MTTRRGFLSVLGTVSLATTSLALSGCGRVPMRTVSGETMGTYFNIVVADAVSDVDMAHISERVKLELSQFVAQVSAYDHGSGLARLNDAKPGVWQQLGGAATKLLEFSRDLTRTSDGTFDATIGPLVELWGFGPKARVRTDVPSDAEIRAALALTGYAGLELDLANRRARRLHPGVQLDVDGIGKGYGVDAVATALTRFGLKHFLVEIGGEVRARGRRANGEAWRVGIAHPDGETPLANVALTAKAIATSGDYQQFYDLGGRRYSHLLDPRSGVPILGNVSSVTVLAENTMTADALSTALAVMGLEAGLAYADAHDIAAYFLHRDADGVAYRKSAAFQAT